MIVVTTPTGNIGLQVVKQLLAAGEAVRVIVRDPNRLDPEVRGKIDVVQGSHDNEAVLHQALDGAESLFWVIPPSFQENNDTEYYLRFTRPACRAILTQGVNRVVGVSALGRGWAGDVGPVTASFANDAEIESTGVSYRALWCPGFMGNLLMQLEPLRNQGMFFLPERPDIKVPRAATRDIAASGVSLLCDRSWTGSGGLAVHGPTDLSHNDIAEIMTDVLGKPIRLQQVPGDAYKAQLIAHGANAVFAQGLVNMHAAKSEGMDNAEQRTAENTTPTTFQQWCEEVLKPAVLG